jgi:hypothetical protein
LLAVDGRKACSACKRELLVSGFGRNVAQKDGLHNQCIPCARESREKHRVKNPERFRAAQRKYQHKLRYGLTPDQYAAMVAEAGNCCTVCGSPPKAPWASLEVDHCHRTGRVRALLCHNCNRSLGHAHDDAALLRKLAEYIEYHDGR